MATRKVTTVETYKYNPEEVTWNRDFHAVMTVTLGELVTDGWIDWTKDIWKWDAYDEDQRERLNNKIEARYWTREIGILPPGEWRRRFIGRLNEIMPKYSLLYDKIKEGIDIWQDSDEYHKERNVTSSYPQTIISGEQDYASGAGDTEYETIRDGNMMDKLKQFQEYEDVDVMILNDLEPLFSSLVTVNVNGL